MFQWITRTISDLGYVGVFVLMALENLFPPIPSEVILPLAGFVAARGQLQLSWVIAVACAGSLGGAWFWYEVGRRIGADRLHRFVERHGRWLTLAPRDIQRAHVWLTRHGAAAVLLGRLIPGLRTLISIPAGLARMSRMRFLVYSAVGTLLWTACLVWAGTLLQHNFKLVERYADVVSNGLFSVLVASLLWRYARCFGLVSRDTAQGRLDAASSKR